MSELDVTPGGEDEEISPVLNEDDGPSLRDKLRAKREELREATTLDLAVPGYDILAVRYGSIPAPEFKALFRKIKQGDGADLQAACNLLARCCQAILTREDEEGDFEPLVDDSDQPIRYDERLAETFGIDGKKAAEVIMGVFSPDRKRDLTVFTHADALISWMRGRGADIDQELLGE